MEGVLFKNFTFYHNLKWPLSSKLQDLLHGHSHIQFSCSRIILWDPNLKSFKSNYSTSQYGLPTQCFCRKWEGYAFLS